MNASSNRPTSVTVIAWILIVFGLIKLVSTMRGLNNPLLITYLSRSRFPVRMLIAFGFLGALSMVISGVFMLRGKNWARLLYFIWTGLGVAVSLITAGFRMSFVPGIVIYAVFLYLLTRTQVVDYFRCPDDQLSNS
jgi:hypothetical protein